MKLITKTVMALSGVAAIATAVVLASKSKTKINTIDHHDIEHDDTTVCIHHDHSND